MPGSESVAPQIAQHTPPNEPKLSVRGLTVSYTSRGKSVTPFADVDFDVQDGEFICIIGPSGAGKSTLLFALAGLVPPSGGTIELAGRMIDGPGGDRAVVFQDDAVFPWYTVEKNVAYGPAAAGWSASQRERAVEESLRLVGLADRRKFYPGQLSGGMRKRVDVARAFAGDPETILMDEPFGGLDTMTKEGLQEAILHIWETKKKTIIFVTHDLEEAAFLADRVFVLQKGGGLQIMPIELPRPRTASMRTEPALQDYRRRLGDLIRGAEGDTHGH
jgi:NitT/TauT family transport system ATP-binding protein|tara:strand:- start:4706 stop:5530 length:825 start_codon:yes stop_codon:yes gene_type:complete